MLHAYPTRGRLLCCVRWRQQLGSCYHHSGPGWFQNSVAAPTHMLQHGNMTAQKLNHHTCSSNQGSEFHRNYATRPKLDAKPQDVQMVDTTTAKTDNSRIRYNAAKIQMIPENLRKQLFSGHKLNDDLPQADLKKVEKHLKSFDLWDKQSAPISDNVFQLPKMFGDNIDEHFRELASSQIRPYVQELEKLLSCEVPRKPAQWAFREGWTRYDPETGHNEAVPYPAERAMVFDVEVLMADGDFPTLATALTSSGWYSWCSHRTVSDDPDWSERRPRLSDLIPLESDQGEQHSDIHCQPRLVIGHNVGFDRTFVREQYFIQGTDLRFLDTMSLHIAVSGQTSLQRILYMAKRSGSRRKEVVEHEHDQAKFGTAASSEWMKHTTLNNLNDVYQFYCKGEPLDKGTRSVFTAGTMADVRLQYQDLMAYCASDVSATLEVVRALWPQFRERFPHPVTLSGMLEMGTAYLPVNQNWDRYIEQSDSSYQTQQKEILELLQKLTHKACELSEGDRYKENVWLWDLDWTVRPYKYRKPKPKPRKKGEKRPEPASTELELSPKQEHMPGFPKWFGELCPKASELENGALPGPSKLTTQRRITPKLLNLTWDGYPLHYSARLGWGYVVPRVYKTEAESRLDAELLQQEQEMLGIPDDAEKPEVLAYPVHRLMEIVKETHPELVHELGDYGGDAEKADAILKQLHNNTGEEDSAILWSRYKALSGKKSQVRKPKRRELHGGVEPDMEVIPGCEFYKLPHKDGADKRVGNPLAKDFLSKIEEGVLKCHSGDDAEVVLRCSKMCGYWKNNMSRIRAQVTVYTDRGEEGSGACSGAILPRVVTAGTITRRAVESTWLTASNAYADRVGSELKSMIQAPPDYHFVGADVDSQELWIASILGDSHFAGLHGSTAFGWMTLQGNKADGTDLHSRTANLVGISRDHAKVFNYGRIYGAGVRFAEQLLKQFNHRLTSDQAKRKAKVMYDSTKGRKVRKTVLPPNGGEDDKYLVQYWQGGSESYMFNKLEEIALSGTPRTPVLGCMISKALEPDHVAGDFMTSRVNWVVQSSAVDYLHLMLVCMRWLLTTYNIRGRFCISIHDEVRYVVASEDRYRAALALQITNLLTRAMFAYKLDLYDLPASVAFFSAVDIDTCLRKEVMMDCVTPSNPRGMKDGYGIPPGEGLTMAQILDRTGGCLNREDND